MFTLNMIHGSGVVKCVNSTLPLFSQKQELQRRKRIQPICMTILNTKSSRSDSKATQQHRDQITPH